MKVRVGLAFALLFIVGSTTSLFADAMNGQPPAYMAFTYTARSSPYPGPLPSGSGWIAVAGGPLTTNNFDDHAVLTGADPAAYNVVAGEFDFGGETFTLQPSYRPGDYFKRGFYIWGDDVYYPTAGPESIVDGFGLAFEAADGSGNWINLFSAEGAHLNEGSANPGLGFFYSSDGDLSPSHEEFSTAADQIAPAPEPSTLTLLSTGGLGVYAFFVRRRMASPGQCICLPR